MLIYDLHEIYNCNVENSHKIYDVIVISSNFDRRVKNINLIENIFNDEKMKSYNLIAVGKNSKKYMPDNVICFDLIKMREIWKLLSLSRLIIIPSYIESYSITAIEATNNSCLTLLSKNVGLSYFINKFFIWLNEYPSWGTLNFFIF